MGNWSDFMPSLGAAVICVALFVFVAEVIAGYGSRAVESDGSYSDD